MKKAGKKKIDPRVAGFMQCRDDLGEAYCDMTVNIFSIVAILAKADLPIPITVANSLYAIRLEIPEPHSIVVTIWDKEHDKFPDQLVPGTE